MTLKGKHGLMFDQEGRVCGHIAAPYDCNGRVFVWTKDGEWWERMTAKRAALWKRQIITCNQCDKPAVQLDHYWPYYNDRTLCADHLNADQLRGEPDAVTTVNEQGEVQVTINGAPEEDS
jgi:hypothetical protein